MNFSIPGQAGKALSRGPHQRLLSGTSARLSRMLLLALPALLLAACTVNLQLPVSGDQQRAATVVALTLQAVGTPAETYEPPMISITGNTNCRSGPGGSFDLITGFTPGTTLELVGRYSATNFWEVKIPNSNETCWVWGQYAEPSGSFDSLPDSSQGSATGSGAPARPGSLYFQYTCPFGELTTNLTWSDAADNEAGYHVYRFDQLIADLPANSTAYMDIVSVTPHSDLQYSVEAYNGDGVSAQRTISFRCE